MSMTNISQFGSVVRCGPQAPQIVQTQALSLDGTNDHVDILGTAGLDWVDVLGNRLEVQCRHKTTTTNTLLSKGGFTGGWYIGSQPRLNLKMTNGNVPRLGLTDAPDDQWHTFDFEYEVTSTTNTETGTWHRLLKDGVDRRGDVTVSNSPASQLLNTTHIWAIGGRDQGSRSPYFSGLIDYLTVTLNGVVLFSYDFEEASGEVLDSGPSGRNGTLRSGASRVSI